VFSRSATGKMLGRVGRDRDGELRRISRMREKVFGTLRKKKPVKGPSRRFFKKGPKNALKGEKGTYSENGKRIIENWGGRRA